MVDNTTFGKEPITIVEIDQDFCSLTYGNSPCTASVGVTGEFKCYNTFKTCQDTANYTLGSPLTLRFCTKTSNFPTPNETELYIPIVQSVSTNPTEVNIASGNENISPLGKRATVNITMIDIPYNDLRVDKYTSDRGFDPRTKGTFWTKWLARNPFYQNRIVRIREGYVGQTVSSMRTRTYILDKVSNVSSGNTVTIVARDILGLANNKKAQAPSINTGSLSADLEENVTSFTLQPTGIGDEQYSSSGKLRIGEELMSFTRTNDDFTVERAIENTELSSHSQDDLVQECLEYVDQRVDVVINDLLTTYGNVDSSFIPLSDWTEEADIWFSSTKLNAIISEPTGVTTLLGEILRQTNTILWWDENAQEIKFRAVKPVTESDVIDIDETANIIRNSFNSQVQANQRLSQVWFYYDVQNPVKELEETSNYSKLQISVDLTKETANEYGEPRITKIFSRWLDDDGIATALSTASTIVATYKDNPEYITFSVDAKDRDIDISDIVRVNYRTIVDFQGNLLNKLYYVISRNETQSGHIVTYKAIRFAFEGRFSFIMANGTPDYTPSFDDDQNACFISDNNGFMSDGTEGWKIL